MEECKVFVIWFSILVTTSDIVRSVKQNLPSFNNFFFITALPGDILCERARELCAENQLRNTLSVHNVHKPRQCDL